MGFVPRTLQSGVNLGRDGVHQTLVIGRIREPSSYQGY